MYIVEHIQSMLHNRDLDSREKGFIQDSSHLGEGHFSYSSPLTPTFSIKRSKKEPRDTHEVSPGTQSPVVLRCNPKVIEFFPPPSSPPHQGPRIVTRITLERAVIN